jgi:hypothetical protein
MTKMLLSLTQKPRLLKMVPLMREEDQIMKNLNQRRRMKMLRLTFLSTKKLMRA